MKNLVPLFAGGLVLSQFTVASAQAPAWQPNRLPAHPAAQQVPNAAGYQAGSRQPQAQAAHAGSTEELGSAVVLRWKRSDNGPEAAPQQSQRAMAQAFNSYPVADQPAAQNPRSASRPNVQPAAASSGTHGHYASNPLRGVVRAAAYQQDPNAGPPLPTGPAGLPPIDGPMMLPGTEQLQQIPDMPPANAGGADPLAQPELAPAPTHEASPFPGNGLQLEQQFGDVAPEQVAPLESDDEPLDPATPGRANTLACNELRQQVLSRPLTAVNLNPSPIFGDGLALDYSDSEQAKNRFTLNTKDREWFDYLGRSVMTGRFVDMKNNLVYVNVDGEIKTIPYLDLSDVDVAYVGKAWNIPGKCGTGYEAFVGREFIPTQFQWTASGLCHKPAYFNNPQLERYGHEVGPVLQPLLSSAHFFGNIAILPYKMGIHPPNECQYSLGYLRPGNCAPYMVQPFPWSLRGAAVQAAAVTGAAALIP